MTKEKDAKKMANDDISDTARKWIETDGVEVKDKIDDEEVFFDSAEIIWPKGTF